MGKWSKWIGVGSRAVWRSYGPLITAVAEAIVEFVLLVGILKLSRVFVQWGAPNLTCDEVIDCVHTSGLVTVWLMLVVSFVGYGIVYGYLKFKARVRHLRGHFEDRVSAVELEVIQNNALVAAVSAAPPRGTFTDRTRALDMLNVAKRTLGEAGLIDRKINLALGRLERQQGRADRAVRILTDFIAQKEQRGLLDVDLGDAYYNRSCYHLEISAHLAHERAQETAKESAYADLERSIELNANNKIDARLDPDFDVIRNEERFKSLVAA
jgi:hypothetical protein